MTGRIEHDSLGSVTIPDGAQWGAQTQRALENFAISGMTVGSYRSLVKALGTIKASAALTNRDIDLLPREIADAIILASRDVINGEADDQFVVDVIQGGAGTSVNMNANEVIANRALAHLGVAPGSYDVVHPIEHVNKCQSTNDVYPTAIRLAVLFSLEPLLDAVSHLEQACAERGRAFADVPKLGRTQLQDAVPMTLGQEFTAFAVTLREDHDRLIDAANLLRECNLGATAIGTGITADERYREQIIERLSAVAGFELLPARDFMEATWDTGAFVQFSGTLKRLATKLSKISSDLRLLSSGPEAGFAEITLPPRQAGSSIMPGKVNPVIPEMVNQIAFFTIGADLTVTLASEHGQLQLNAFEPAIAHALLQTMRWLTNGTSALADLCISGIHARPQLTRPGAVTAQGTALVPLLGYAAAADLVRQATQTGTPAIVLALEQGLINEEQANAVLALR